MDKSLEISKSPVVYFVIVIAILLITYFALGKIIKYHWEEFEHDANHSARMKKIFSRVSIALLMIMVFGAILYFAS